MAVTSHFRTPAAARGCRQLRASASADGLGYDHIWVSDHVIFKRRQLLLPLSGERSGALRARQTNFEPLAALNFLRMYAASASGHPCVILPYPQPSADAKMLSRLTCFRRQGNLGAGVGWMEESSRRWGWIPTPSGRGNRRVHRVVQGTGGRGQSVLRRVSSTRFSAAAFPQPLQSLLRRIWIRRAYGGDTASCQVWHGWNALGTAAPPFSSRRSCLVLMRDCGR